MVRALKLPAVVVLAVTAVLMTGCGSSGDTGAQAGTGPSSGSRPTSTPSSSASPTTTPAPLPRCAAVWVIGKALADDFDGCAVGGHTFATRLRCENGQQFFTYRGRYFAVPGGRVFAASGALADDSEYQRMHRACTA